MGGTLYEFLKKDFKDKIYSRKDTYGEPSNILMCAEDFVHKITKRPRWLKPNGCKTGPRGR